MIEPKVNVIIPTFNRIDSLKITLSTLANQTYPSNHFEVIIVDDGSTDATLNITTNSYPYKLHYFWQTNQGDASARNLGACKSTADHFVFLDDDMVIESDYLQNIIKAHTSPNMIVVGTEFLWPENSNPLEKSIQTESSIEKQPETVQHYFPFVYSRNMSIQRQAYFDLGMMQGLDFPGSSIWCDVDFAYRASLQGFVIVRSTKAICYHRDYVVRSIENRKKRNYEAAYRAVALFQKYPNLLPHIAMFHDKVPIAWRQDPLDLIGRKLVRSMASSGTALLWLEKMIQLLEQNHALPVLLPLLNRWVIGGHIYQGYRKGLRDLGPVRGYE